MFKVTKLILLYIKHWI